MSAMTEEPPSGPDPDPDVVSISDGSDVELAALASDPEDVACAKCGEGDDERNLVLCDECPQGFPRVLPQTQASERSARRVAMPRLHGCQGAPHRRP